MDSYSINYDATYWLSTNNVRLAKWAMTMSYLYAYKFLRDNNQIVENGIDTQISAVTESTYVRLMEYITDKICDSINNEGIYKRPSIRVNSAMGIRCVSVPGINVSYVHRLNRTEVKDGIMDIRVNYTQSSKFVGSVERILTPEGLLCDLIDVFCMNGNSISPVLLYTFNAIRVIGMLNVENVKHFIDKRKLDISQITKDNTELTNEFFDITCLGENLVVKSNYEMMLARFLSFMEVLTIGQQ